MKLRACLLALLLQTAPVAAAAEPPAPGRLPAVSTLVERARQAAAAGAVDRAEAFLERALGIAPADAWLWHRLAVLRLQRGAWRQAEDLALRSNALTGQPRLLAGNWELIARAREGRGDPRGAAQARGQAAGPGAP